MQSGLDLEGGWLCCPMKISIPAKPASNPASFLASLSWALSVVLAGPVIGSADGEVAFFSVYGHMPLVILPTYAA